jgi:hypothetical protein
VSLTAAKAEAGATSNLPKWWWLVIPMLASVAYAPALALSFSGEDFVFVHHAATRPFYEPSQNLFYRPFPALFWEIDYRLWGLTGNGYHLTNLLLHAVNAGLVALLATRLLSSRKAGLLAGLFFALHPVHAEPVLWLSGRPDLLATLWGLLALLAGLQFLQKQGRLAYAFSLLAYGLALFSKEGTATVPLVLVALGWTHYRKVANRMLLLPYGGVLAIYLIVRVAALGGLGGYEQDGREWLNALWNIAAGLWLPLLFPVNFEALGVWVGLALGVGLALLYLWQATGLLKQRGTWFANFLQLVVATYLLYLPAVSIVPVSQNLTQSRNLYLPSVGFCLILALLLALVRRKGWWLAGMLVVGLALAFVPWLSSARVIPETLAQLKAAALPVSPGDTVYYEGLPDSYRGAYLWRNGLDEATRLVVGPGVAAFNRTPELIVDYRRADNGRVWFLRYHYNESNRTPALKFSYAVFGYGVEDLKAEVERRWNFLDCQPGEWKWTGQKNSLRCEPGRGLLYRSGGEKLSYSVDGPVPAGSRDVLPLELTATVNYDFSHRQVLVEAIIQDGNGRELYRIPFDMSADGRIRRYYLLLHRPASSGEPDDHLMLKVNKSRNDILWRQITYYRIP